jgi:hypothetical protein
VEFSGCSDLGILAGFLAGLVGLGGASSHSTAPVRATLWDWAAGYEGRGWLTIQSLCSTAAAGFNGGLATSCG